MKAALVLCNLPQKKRKRSMEKKERTRKKTKKNTTLLTLEEFRCEFKKRVTSRNVASNLFLKARSAKNKQKIKELTKTLRPSLKKGILIADKLLSGYKLPFAGFFGDICAYRGTNAKNEGCWVYIEEIYSELQGNKNLPFLRTLLNTTLTTVDQKQWFGDMFKFWLPLKDWIDTHPVVSP
jgi:hypothetical protein